MVQLNLDLFFRNNEYGQWPASGEIDILESRGKLNLLSNKVYYNLTLKIMLQK